MPIKNDSTAVDIIPEHHVSDEEAKLFNIQPHLISLMWAEPFYSHIIRQTTKISTDTIPTAGVMVDDGAIKLWYNPKFLAGLSTAKLKGLLKHECMHIVFEHTTTRRHEPFTTWNWAADLAINSLIPEGELPDGGLLPGRLFKELTSEDIENMDSKRIEQYNKLSKFIETLPKKKNSEWYFAKLLEDKEIAEAIESTDGLKAELGDDMDVHDMWDQISDEDREIIKEKVRQLVGDAAKECDKKGNWGSVSYDTRATIRSLVSNEIPWQSVLRQFCGLNKRQNRSSSVRRIHRKYPGIHPGMQHSYTSAIAVYVDQSGSVTDSDLELLFGELKGLSKHTSFTMFNFDTEVDESTEREWHNSRSPKLERTRWGGTNFNAPMEHANKNKHRFDGYLILTDGEASDPGSSKLKRGWVIIPNRKLLFTPSGRDFVVNMRGINTD
ncbi:hypothetical protein CL622_02055 [archaeon]|nr:hypothetical protein [archaeon]|tara:strand:+ start:1681 stop:2997 length:1317 start_codon:yes stop_codon:yes gene_type:complete